MIGGAMLACAVGAMVLIAWWSLPLDDAENPAEGLFALRSWSERTVARNARQARGRGNRGPRSGARKPDPVEGPRLKANGKRDRRPNAAPAKRRRRL